MNHTGVGRHLVACAELDDVARHERLRVDDAKVSVPHDRGPRRVELTQRFHRAPGAPFGHEANQRIDDENGRDGGGLEAIAQQQRDDGSRDQEKDDDTGQLVAENDQR